MRRGIMHSDSLFNAFARSYEARSETDMSMAEYLESCRGDPMRYANAAERLLAAIGEPQMIDTAKDARLRRILWHGRNHRAHRRLLPARSSRSGRAQADSLSAGAGGRWKIVAGGAAEIVDGSPSHLRAEGRRRTQSSVREPPEFVRSGIAGADDSRKVRHSAPSPPWTDESVVLQTAGSIRRRHFTIPGRQNPALALAADRGRENRAWRREQSGHLLAGRQGRHSQAGDLRPERP